MSVISYIGLGSNLNHPINQVKQGISEINQIEKSKLLKCSSLYETSPHGPVADQANFINAVAALETELSVEDLYQQLKAIEKKHNREHALRWGPRTLDLDILFYGTETIATDRLQIPHPRIIERLFVLIPLQEIHPKFRLPNNKTIEEQILLLKLDEIDEKVDMIPEDGVVSTENG